MQSFATCSRIGDLAFGDKVESLHLMQMVKVTKPWLFWPSFLSSSILISNQKISTNYCIYASLLGSFSRIVHNFGKKWLIISCIRTSNDKIQNHSYAPCFFML